MALSANILRNELGKVCVQDHPQFLGFGSSNSEVGNRWATAIFNYARNCNILSLSHPAARIQCANTFLGLTNNPNNGLVIIQQALINYAAVMSTGTQPTFTSTPPATLVNLIPVFSLGLSGASSQMCVDMLTGIIDPWFRTGFSVNNQSGATINWS